MAQKRSASGSTDFPLNSERDRAWMAEQADATVKKWASSDGSGSKDKMDWTKYASAHFWRDDANKTNFSGYKLGFVEVVDGKATAVWHAVTACAAVIQGGRGGVNIPSGDVSGVKLKIEAYYAKARSEFNDATIKVPWAARAARLPSLQAREMTFEPDAQRSLDAGIPVVISSDAVVEMPEGPEILVHAPGAVDLSRAPLPIIAGHRDGQINVGIIDSLQIAGGKLRGVARFGTRKEAVEYRDDVMGGIIRSLSAGYARLKGYVRKDGVLMTTQWMPFHAAMVGEPADANAGFFRNADSVPPFQITDPPKEEVSRSSVSVRDDCRQTAAPAALQGVAMSDVTNAAAAGNAAENHVVMGTDNAQTEKLRITSILNLSRQNYGPYKPTDEDRERWIQEGKTTNEVSAEILEQIHVRSKAAVKDSPANMGLSDAEVKKYSVTRAIRACTEKSWPKVAPFEAEISQALGRRMGKQAGEYNFFVPLEVQMANGMGRGQRAELNVATSTLGGYLVGTQVTGFIDLLRNRSVVMRMGATMLPGLSGSVSIPKLTGASTGYWFASEAGTATESSPTFGQLALTPKTVGGYVEISRQLLLQTQYNADAIINSDLARVIGLAVDSAAIAGPGTAGQPTGITVVSGIGTANPSTGTAVNYADMIRFQSVVAGANAFMPGFGYVTTPTVAGVFMGKPRFTNSDTPIWQGNILDGQVVGAQAMTTLQVGSGTVLAGDFSNVVIGEWGVLEIEANPYAQFQSGIIGIRALYTVDVGVRYAAAFALGTGFVS